MLEQVRDGQVEVGFVHKGVDEFLVKLDEAMNRLVVAVVVATGGCRSALIGIFAEQGPHALGLHLFAFVGFFLSGILLLWLLVGVIRHGRLAPCWLVRALVQLLLRVVIGIVLALALAVLSRARPGRRLRSLRSTSPARSVGVLAILMGRSGNRRRRGRFRRRGGAFQAAGDVSLAAG